MDKILISELSSVKQITRNENLIKKSDKLIQDIVNTDPQIHKTAISQKAVSEYQKWSNHEIETNRKSFELMKYDYDKWLKTLVSDEYVSDD
jgi:hypothetical protein